jgi:hypothetical protein
MWAEETAHTEKLEAEMEEEFGPGPYVMQFGTIPR